MIGGNMDVEPKFRLINAAARLLYRDASLNRHYPMTPADILTTGYDAKNAWKDLGATKSGVQIESDKWIRTQLAELNLDRLKVIKEDGMARRVIELAIMYMTRDEGLDSGPFANIELEYWPRVRYIENRVLPHYNESSSIFITFEILS